LTQKASYEGGGQRRICAVPTIKSEIDVGVVGTLCFAHTTQFRGYGQG
jgi:hypothetical protein